MCVWRYKYNWYKYFFYIYNYDREGKSRASREKKREREREEIAFSSKRGIYRWILEDFVLKRAINRKFSAFPQSYGKSDYEIE